MKTKYIIISVFCLLLYTSISFYIGSRIAASFAAILSPGGIISYWIVFTFLSSSYFLGRIGNVFFPGNWGDRLIWLGAYWLGAIFYFGWLWAIADGIVWLGHALTWLPADTISTVPQVAVTILLVTTLLLVYGIWRANKLQIIPYEITIEKTCSLERLSIVMVSDLHLGLLVGKRRLEKLVKHINELNPDLVLLPGDILDENVGAFLDNRMPDVLRQLRPPLGVYGCLGSHEYIWGKVDKAIRSLQQAGITILRDEYIFVADTFVLIGRDDRYKEELTGIARKQLHEIVALCDTSRPVILMDHQPVDLKAGQKHGVDLYLSGHTHGGQLFPLNLLTGALFKIDRGYARLGPFHMIVSSGFGTWGPPLRIASAPEICHIQVQFAKE